MVLLKSRNLYAVKLFPLLWDMVFREQTDGKGIVFLLLCCKKQGSKPPALQLDLLGHKTLGMPSRSLRVGRGT